jgi:hypothetical protein
MSAIPQDLRPLWGAALLLLASGVVHWAVYLLDGGSWEGSLSWRKSILFGLSTGVTVASLAWVWGKLPARRGDRWLPAAVAGALTVEVGLITLQTWRGVPSHFHRETPFDAAVETLMLALVVAATGVIAWLTWRSFGAVSATAVMRRAIRAGMVLLLVSCGVGFGITALGWWQLSLGNSPQVWGTAGVLKFPHGICLHAIQTLPAVAWLLERFRVTRPLGRINDWIAVHALALTYALWQTGLGRSRWDWEAVGLIVLLIGVGCGLRACWPQHPNRARGDLSSSQFAKGRL